MKKIFFPTLILLSSILYSASSNATIFNAPANDSATLIQLETDITKAIISHNKNVFEKLLAPRFIYTENESTYSRTESIEAFTSASDTIEQAFNENMVVYISGTTGIVTGFMNVKGRNAQGRFNHRYRFTDTWVKTKGEWQILAGHDYIKP